MDDSSCSELRRSDQGTIEDYSWDLFTAVCRGSFIVQRMVNMGRSSRRMIL